MINDFSLAFEIFALVVAVTYLLKLLLNGVEIEIFLGKPFEKRSLQNQRVAARRALA